MMKPPADPQCNTCPECGGPVAGGLPRALCSSCALRGALAVPDDFPANAADSPEVSRVPYRFGDYDLIGEIAHGGMGVVWKARQLSLNRLVALKLILAGRFAKAEEVSRFRVEAEAVAQLRHPHIVAIYETGEFDGQHFISMEYVSGRTLGDAVVNGLPVSPERAARYAQLIAEAVQHAHDHGILHRDLKPSNVLIDPDDQPRVTDFGLAKRFDSDSDLTATGQLLGSPNYSPPEQLGGAAGPGGPANDVYSIGAILYYLITGRLPFAAAKVADTLRQVLNVEPVPPRSLDPGLPRDLETICLKCLQKDPARRYPSARELAEDLSRFRLHEPIRARPISVVGHLHRWTRRNPLGATFVLVLFVGLVVTGLLLRRLWVEGEKNQDRLQVIRERLIEDLEELWTRPDRSAENISSETLAALMNSQRPRLGHGEGLRLTVGVSVSESPFAQIQRYEPMLAQLERRLGIALSQPVRLDLRLSKFNTLDLDSMHNGRLALKRLGALSYVNLHADFPGFTAIVREDQPKDCVFFTRKGSGIVRLNDLAGRSFAFGDVYSTISFWAKVHLARAGICGTNLSRWDHLDSHQAYLDRLQHSGLRSAMATAMHSHAEVIKAVRLGRYDAGIARRGYIQDFVRRDFDIIQEFESTPNPWVAGEGLDPKVVSALQHALLKQEGSSSGLSAHFVEVNDAYFDPLRQAITNEVLRFEGARRYQSPIIEDDE